MWISAECGKQDFYNQLHFRWAAARQLDLPMRFVQGAEDVIHPPSGIQPLSAQVQVPDVTVLPGIGHLPHGADLRRFPDASLIVPDTADAR